MNDMAFQIERDVAGEYVESSLVSGDRLDFAVIDVTKLNFNIYVYR